MLTRGSSVSVLRRNFIERYHTLTAAERNSVDGEGGFTITEVVFAALFSIVVTFSVAAIALGAMDVLSTTQSTALVREKPERILNEMTEYIQKATMIVPLNYNTTTTDGIAKFGDKQLTLIYERYDDGTNTTCEVHRYNINDTASETVNGTTYKTGTLTHKAVSKVFVSTGEPCTANYKALMDAIGAAAVDAAGTVSGLNTDFSVFKYYNESGQEFPKSGVQTVQGSTGGGTVTQTSIGSLCTLDPNASSWSIPASDVRTTSVTLSFARGKDYAAGWTGHDEITGWATPQNVAYGGVTC